jgi:hypothetical protein
MFIERTIRDVVIANRILAQNNVLDAYGHVSMRHPERHDRYFLARSISPAIAEVKVELIWVFQGDIGFCPQIARVTELSFLTASDP